MKDVPTFHLEEESVVGTAQSRSRRPVAMKDVATMLSKVEYVGGMGLRDPVGMKDAPTMQFREEYV